MIVTKTIEIFDYELDYCPEPSQQLALVRKKLKTDYPIKLLSVTNDKWKRSKILTYEYRKEFKKGRKIKPYAGISVSRWKKRRSSCFFA